MRTHPAGVALLAVALSPAAASAAEWRDVGRISPAGQVGQVHAQGVDAAGRYTALFRPLTGTREEELGEETEVYGPVLTRDRAPRGRFVTRPGFDANNAVLAVVRGGEQIAASVTGAPASRTIEIRRRAPGGAWSERQVVAAGQVQPEGLGVAVAPNGEAVVWWNDQRVSTPQRRSVLMAATRPARATAFSPAQALAEGRLSRASVELDRAGNAVAAWTSGDTGDLRIARRPAGGSFNAPGSIAVAGRAVVDETEAPRLDVAPNGRAIVTWNLGPDGQEFAPGVAAATGSARGGFGAPVVLSDRGSGSAAATDGALTAITWAENGGADGRTRAVLLPGDAELATARERVLSGRAVPYGTGALTVARGRATFAWLRRVRGPRVVEARTATASGRFTRTQRLSSRRVTASEVALTTSSRGEPWVTWAAQQRGARNRAIGANAARASVRSGRFSRSSVIRRGAVTTPPPLLAGRNGTMFAAVTRGTVWYLRAYGKRPRRR